MMKELKIMNRHVTVGLLTMCIICSSCASMDMEEMPSEALESFEIEDARKSKRGEKQETESFVEEELKNQEIIVKEKVVYIERPVYVPESEAKNIENLKGTEAVKNSERTSTVLPEQYNRGTFYYQYNENLVYEIYAQPYHLTDICLQTGEVVIANPLLSEDEGVWELTAGVARDPVTNEDIQHLFIKPAYSNLDSSLIIITDRRVYHLRVKSFKDTHMAMVKFIYPGNSNVWAKKNDGNSSDSNLMNVSRPELLSFDYKVKFSKTKKPEFVPTRVYDDGRQTYIQVSEIVLQKKLPVLFNERNEIINYTVKKNVFIIPRLIDEVTLRLGNEKVIVTKKINKQLSKETDSGSK